MHITAHWEFACLPLKLGETSTTYLHKQAPARPSRVNKNYAFDECHVGLSTRTRRFGSACFQKPVMYLKKRRLAPGSQILAVSKLRVVWDLAVRNTRAQATDKVSAHWQWLCRSVEASAQRPTWDCTSLRFRFVISGSGDFVGKRNGICKSFRFYIATWFCLVW